MPGSKDLVDFDYISDQPDIAVETWGDSNLVAGAGQGVVTSEATAAETAVVLNGGHDPAHPSHQQQVTEAPEPAGFQDQHASSAQPATEQQAGVGAGATGYTADPEVEEYLESQETFSYDRPSTGNSTATAEDTLGQWSGDWASRGGADAATTAVGAPGLGPEHSGWGSTTDTAVASSKEQVQLGNNHNPVDGGLDVWVDYDADAAAADENFVPKGMFAAEAVEYDPSTPSYGMEE